MTHIKTLSDAEASMKALYKKAAHNSRIVAQPQHEEAIAEIIKLTQEQDIRQLRISELRGSLMGYMQHHTILEDQNGKTLLTWSPGSASSKIDIAGIIAEMNIPEEIVQKYTTKSIGSRVFKIND